MGDFCKVCVVNFVATRQSNVSHRSSKLKRSKTEPAKRPVRQRIGKNRSKSVPTEPKRQRIEKLPFLTVCALNCGAKFQQKNTSPRRSIYRKLRSAKKPKRQRFGRTKRRTPRAQRSDSELHKFHS